ncbi:MAG: DUF3581 domain-containing protein [Cellvibrionaceae bacterium]|nr:DUF3581 domain-containing protein [Cellvibrionaceae bacterium]MCV6626867.1 DUF3581 domain-containing protein [Cellvibrionaceae bacterium]
MQIDQYFTPNPGNPDQFSFSRAQASDFAKFVANDYNPIHDIDAKRFCVPGDLLFAVSLAKSGLNQQMDVDFADMVVDGVELTLEHKDQEEILRGGNDKEYLHIHRRGAHSDDPSIISQLSESYVAYSGKTFPHILVPLMREQGVMINPARPLVIYESARIELDHLDFSEPRLEGAESSLAVDGKRGSVRLGFDIFCGEQKVGHGEKRMVLSGLREFDEAAMQAVVDYYNERTKSFSRAS